MNITAGEVAAEMRRIADALDSNPSMIIRPYLVINTVSHTRTQFAELAKTMPKPMEKGIDFEGTSYEGFKLSHSFWSIKIPRSEVCIIKEPARPAVYDCPSIFSPAEEEELEKA